VTELSRAAETVVRRCLGVREGENVLVITDPERRPIAEAFRDEAERAGADAVLGLMSLRATDGTEPPAPLAEALQACDAYLAPTSRSISHTQARKRATDAGIRGATLPHVTAELLARLMDVDFDALGVRSRAVADVLDKGDEARVTCPRGTDLRFDLRGRRGLPDDGDLTKPGAFGNLPCGEGFIAPAGGEGRMATISIAVVGLAPEPAILTLEDGRLTSVEGAAGEALLSLLDPHGPEGRNLAELGVGTNDRATLTGNVLEDEKILGTIHVAFGASAAIGGTVSVPIHLDCVVMDASLEVDGTPVLDAGQFLL
jgi:leucyl aminopeptidase (aminopeptidase T)